MWYRPPDQKIARQNQQIKQTITPKKQNHDSKYIQIAIYSRPNIDPNLVSKYINKVSNISQSPAKQKLYHHIQTLSAKSHNTAQISDRRPGKSNIISNLFK